MDLSIIIAHYNPKNHPNSLKSFHKTLSSICNQKGKFNIEVIIADDGSLCNSKLINYNSSKIIYENTKIFCLSNKKLNKWKEDYNYNYDVINKWLYYPKDNNSMNKARLGNVSIQVSKSDNLLFLDDDNYFITENSIQEILNHLNSFDLVIGQIKDANGRLRKYNSNRVQGTTFAIKKHIMESIGGFGVWTESVSSAVDSDIWWKLYNYFISNSNKKACYTNKFQTLDSCSKRWKPHIKKLFRYYAVKKEFYRVHGCPNYRKIKYNPSRIKSKWITNLT